MNHCHLAYRAIGLLATLVAIPAVAQSEPDTSNWQCRLCPLEQTSTVTTHTGAGYVSDDAPRFGNATGLDEQGSYLDLETTGHWFGPNMDLAVRGEDLLLDARDVRVDYSLYGIGALRLSHRGVPARYFSETRMLLREGPGGVLAPPDNWIPAATTAGFDSDRADLRIQPLENDWQQTALSFVLVPAENWHLRLGVERQTEDGRRATGLADFSQAVLVAAPVDTETHNFSADVGYLAPRAGITVSRRRSDYNNRRESVRWQTPFVTAAGPQFSELALAPDNQHDTLSVATYTEITPATRLSLRFDRARLLQDDELFAYTSNDALARPLPRTNAGASADLRALRIGLRTHASPALRFRIRYTADRRDNETTIDAWQRVIADRFDSGEQTTNRRFGFDKRRLAFDVRWRLHRSLTAAAGLTNTRTDRREAIVTRLEETQSWVKVDWRPASGVRARATIGGGERDVADTDEIRLIASGSNPGHQSYFVAYRFRQHANFQLSYQPLDALTSLDVGFGVVDDDYGFSELGIRDQQSSRWQATLQRPLGETSSAFLQVHGERNRLRMDGSEAFSAADWRHGMDDRFAGVRLGGSTTLAKERLWLSLTVGLTRASTDLGTRTGSEADRRFPKLRSNNLTTRLRGEWRHDDRLSSFFGVAYDALATTDWALDGIDYLGLPTVVGLDADANDHRVWQINAGFRRQFGR